MVATLVTALLVFWIAYDDATFGLVARSSLAIALWWVIGVGVAFGLLHRPSRRSFWGVAALFAGFAAWTGASLLWATSDERAFNEFNRVTLYLGVFVLAALVAPLAAVSRWADGLALGIVGTGVLALTHRFFPDAFPTGEHSRYFTGPQLSYPVEYVNGLGILLALSVPLLLRAATWARTPAGRAAWVAPLPALAAAIYLTSSRGGVIVAATGAIVLLALSHRRWATVGALAVGLVGSAGAIAILTRRPALVDEPLSRAAEDSGPGAALLIGLVCVGAGVVYAAGNRLLREWEPPRAVGWATVAATCALLATGIAAANPVENFESFRKPPTQAGARDPNYTVRGHLLSANSTGRWQFWDAAAAQFQDHPVVGDGAGSYEAWWARHGTFVIFVRDAHSLYLETLGELGIVGFFLLIAAFALGGTVAIQQTRRAAGSVRAGYAALTACFAAFAVGAGGDWMWEFTVVSVAGLAALGWVLGSGTDRAAGPPLRALIPAVAFVAVVCQAVPLTATLAIRDSQAAVRGGDLAEGLDRAQDARDLQPWAASPRLQLALVFEQAGNVPEARRLIREAVQRDRADWRLWLVQARLETKAGAVQRARRSLRRASELNPRSPIFSTD